MQYRWKKHNSTAQEPKHVFAAIKLKAAYFKHRKGKTLSFVTKLKPAEIRYKQTKRCFDKFKRQKRISCREKL